MKSILIILTFLVSSFVSLDDTSRQSFRIAPDETSGRIALGMPKTAFVGSWIAEDKQTRGYTKCVIKLENNRYVIQLWAACAPKDCEWGKQVSEKVKKSAEEFEIKVDHGFAQRILDFRMENGKLRIDTQNQYTDRPNNSQTDFMVRQTK